MSVSCDVLVLGAGPGGYVAAIRAGQLGLKTVLVEKDPSLGGTCLNVGCIPSKTLLHVSEQYYLGNHSSFSGISFDGIHIDLPTLMGEKEGIISGLNKGIAGLLKKHKV